MGVLGEAGFLVCDKNEKGKKKPPGSLRRFFEYLRFQVKRISLYELRRGLR
jgi:hypothetical protein